MTLITYRPLFQSQIKSNTFQNKLKSSVASAMTFHSPLENAQSDATAKHMPLEEDKGASFISHPVVTSSSLLYRRTDVKESRIVHLIRLLFIFSNHQVGLVPNLIPLDNPSKYRHTSEQHRAEAGNRIHT